MKHVLLDTNILVDRSFRQLPHDAPSLQVLRGCQLSIWQGYTTTWSLMTLMYLMDASRDPSGRRIWTKRQIVHEATSLLTFITVVEAGNGSFNAGFTMAWSDWGDAVIYSIANDHPLIEAIVTNDADFVKRTKKLPGIKAIAPGDLL